MKPFSATIWDDDDARAPADGYGDDTPVPADGCEDEAAAAADGSDSDAADGEEDAAGGDSPLDSSNGG